MTSNNNLPKKVYYLPSRINKLVIEKLKKFEPMGEVEFKVVGEGRGWRRAIEPIERIKNRRAVLIWGNGYSHSLSFYFDIKRDNKVKIKRCIDKHDDCLFDYVFSCGSHLFYSHKKHGYLIELASPTDFRKLRRGGGWKGGRKSVFIEADYHKKADYLHLSIDFDGVKFFPADGKWISTGEGYSIDKVVGAVLKAKETGKLKRLDFGGLTGKIPDFEVIAHPEEMGVPDFDEDVLREERYRSKKRANMAGTYAVSCFYKILKAAMFG